MTRRNGRHRLRALPAGIGLLALTGACASIGNPSGGPRDEDPPRYVRSNPAPGSTNFNGNRINIEFDEIVTVQDAMTKVVVSPPGASTPRVSSQGRRVTVELNDTLQPNTTYTVDFANSIQDNNEGNPLQGFTFTFSTGPQIDTLRISGMVLSADALEPQQGMLVGIHPAEADTAFTTARFSRMAKTDDRGRFTIYGLRPGDYRVYALADMDGDLRYANPEEDLAFYPITVSPSAERIETTDTIFNLLTGEVDSVKTRMRTRHLPNDLLLRSFNVGRRQQFIEKYERPDSARILLRFNAAADSLPRVWPAGQPALWEGVVAEHSATNDTITYWLPPALASRDTLSLAVSYLRADSVGRMTDVADTLSLITPRRKAVKDDKKEKAKKSRNGGEETDTTPKRLPSPLTLEMAGSSTHEVYLPVWIDFSRPLARLDTAAIHLEERLDTVWTPVAAPYAVSMDNPLSPRRLTLDAPWEYGRKYRIVADTLAAADIYGAVSDPWTVEFSARAENEYSTLTLSILGLPDTIPAYVDLLDRSENVVRRAPVSDGKAYMPYLAAGKYYARVSLDYDGDGKYTTGDYAAGRQPEPSFYCPKAINVRKNWDADQTWDVFAIPVDTQKPSAIKKNKPEQGKNRQPENEEENEEDDGTYDPDYNPFDPNSRKRTYGSESTRL